MGFTRSLLKSMGEVNVVTQGGLIVGRKPAYDVNLARLDNVARRITKGIFYHEKGYRLPDGYEVDAFSESGLRDLSDEPKHDLRTQILQPLMSNAPKIIGKQTFSYRVAFSDTDPNTSAWLLVFYERVSFLCLSLPRDQMVRA